MWSGDLPCRYRLCRWSSSKGSIKFPWAFPVFFHGWLKKFNRFWSILPISCHLFISVCSWENDLSPADHRGCLNDLAKWASRFLEMHVSDVSWEEHSSSNEKANFPVKFCDLMPSPVKTHPSRLRSFCSNVIHITQQGKLPGFFPSLALLIFHLIMRRSSRQSLFTERTLHKTTSDWSVCSEINQGKMRSPALSR